MSAIGRRHFRSESVDLEETLREKSIEYFNSHHRHSLDELAMFLEMEAWETVPVKRHFGYKDLPVSVFIFLKIMKSSFFFSGVRLFTPSRYSGWKS